MSRLLLSSENEIDCYLRSGKHDSSFQAWRGNNFLESAQQGSAALRQALISTVRSRTAHATVPKELLELDVTALTRKAVEPMVRCLFPKDEQAAVLDVLAGSVVFLTPSNIGAVLSEMQWLHTAWNLGNLYLGGFDDELLSEDAPNLVGLSIETTC